MLIAKLEVVLESFFDIHGSSRYDYYYKCIILIIENLALGWTQERSRTKYVFLKTKPMFSIPKNHSKASPKLS